MSLEEYIGKSILEGRGYEDLHERVRKQLSFNDWRNRVKAYCINEGFSYLEGLASSSCQEDEYYLDLVKYYQVQYRVFPYHLSDYVTKFLRISSFKYYVELMYDALRTEKSYSQIPNFTAADMVKQLGVGRNEYINIQNQCKTKKLMWKMNRSYIREYLPQQPLGPQPQKWWKVKNTFYATSETVERHANSQEYNCWAECGKAEENQSPLQVRNVNEHMLWSLFCKGYVYFKVPIQPSNKFNIPPLEGFVSNKDASEKGDPLDGLLYNIFVAHSAHLTAQELADILDVPFLTLQRAVAVAVRLGFASLIEESQEQQNQSQVKYKEGNEDLLLLQPHEYDVNDEHSPISDQFSSQYQNQNIKQQQQVLQQQSGQEKGFETSDKAVGVIVDAEVTSYLMMGALSPGMKRHAVTLFEGGRLKGSEQMDDMLKELKASLEIAQEFEGDMKNLSVYAQSLAVLLETLKYGKSSRQVELLRKESLAGLNPDAVQNVLSHQYIALIQISPLPYPPLPCPPMDPLTPLNYGPLPSACTPWIQLALYSEVQDGPISLIFPRGIILNELPCQLDDCGGALVWLWDPLTIPKQATSSSLYGSIWLEKKFLLLQLNYWLQKTALMVQPMPSKNFDDVKLACIPLPQYKLNLEEPIQEEKIYKQSTQQESKDLNNEQQNQTQNNQISYNTSLGIQNGGLVQQDLYTQIQGVDQKTQQLVSLQVSRRIIQGLRSLGVFSMVGYITMFTQSWVEGQEQIREIKQVVDKNDVSYQLQDNKLPLEIQKDQPIIQQDPTKSIHSHKTESSSGNVSNQNIINDPKFLRLEQNKYEEYNHQSQIWKPLAINLGVPLHEVELCNCVCQQAKLAKFLSSDAQVSYRKKQIYMYRKMQEIVSLFSLEVENYEAQDDNGKYESLLTGSSILQGFTFMPAVSFMFNTRHLDELQLNRIQQGYQLIV